MFRIYPNDEDGDAPPRVADDGSDMSAPMKIDFSVAVPDESNGQIVAKLVAANGFTCDVVKVHDGSSWTCHCTKEMVPTYNAIIASQKELNELSKPFGGYSNGWGTLGNKDKAH